MALPSTDAAAQQIQESLKAVHQLMHRIEGARSNSEFNLVHIEKIQEEIGVEGKMDSVESRKLKRVYSKALEDAGKEERLLREALNKIHEIRDVRNQRRLQARLSGNKEAIRRGTLMKMLQVTAQTLPLHVSTISKVRAPALCGSIPAEHNYTPKPGDMVAAFVKNEADENWILSEVLSYDPAAKRYEVEDVDEEEKQRYHVAKRNIIPLPLMKANPETDAYALFPRGATVMALYPQTTCFYKGVINAQPTTVHEEYEIYFEDSSYAEGYSPAVRVPQRYVINVPKRRVKSQSVSSLVGAFLTNEEDER